MDDRLHDAASTRAVAEDVLADFRCHDAAAVRANFALCSMLGDLYLDRRKVADVAFFFRHDRLIGQITAAFRAGVERDRHAEIGVFALEQCLPGVAGLATGFAPRIFGAEGFGFAPESIAGGRLAAVGAVFIETIF